MIEYKLYEVGGKIRDMLMNIESDDTDYSVVITNKDSFSTADDAFVAFEQDIKEKGYTVFQSTPEVFTIRSKFPDSKEVADFVIARKEQGYRDNTRRPDLVELGTLEDDLRRRDFTVNAMAMDSHGEITDPFNGKRDIRHKILKTPIEAHVSIEDDPLRIVRAYRFVVTKGFTIHEDLVDAIKASSAERFDEVVSANRIQQEMTKMFKYDSKSSIEAMQKLQANNSDIYDIIFDVKKIRLFPTLKEK